MGQHLLRLHARRRRRLNGSSLPLPHRSVQRGRRLT